MRRTGLSHYTIAKKDYKEGYQVWRNIHAIQGKTYSEIIMAGHNIPHFQNDGGHRVIEIGVKEFMCTGASVPYDHPHIFIDLGDESEKVCSYCSTLYRYNPSLKADQTNPAGCVFQFKAA